MDKPHVKSALEAERLACAVTVQTQVHDRRTIIMQTYIDRDAGVEQYHSLLDKLSTASDRQETKYRLIDEKMRLQADEMMLKNTESDLIRVGVEGEKAWKTSGRNGPYKPNNTEQGRENTLKTNITVIRTRIEERKGDIAKLEETIGKG